MRSTLGCVTHVFFIARMSPESSEKEEEAPKKKKSSKNKDK